MPTKREPPPAAEKSAVAEGMQHWSDAKLDFELVFAEAGLVETWPETVAWLAAIRAEVARRKTLERKADAA
jgi:hypothetical protein